MLLNIITLLVLVAGLVFCILATRRAVADEQPVAAPAPEERRDERIAARCDASLGWLSPRGSTLLPVRVRDISRGGVQVQSPDPLAPGDTVFAHIPQLGIMRTAIVRHCESASSRFRIGLEFQDAPMQVQRFTYHVVERAAR